MVVPFASVLAWAMAVGLLLVGVDRLIRHLKGK